MLTRQISLTFSFPAFFASISTFTFDEIQAKKAEKGMGTDSCIMVNKHVFKQLKSNNVNLQ